MHREDIKASLHKKGSSLAAIAAELDCHFTHVTHVVAGKRSRRVEAYVAKTLGMPVEVVFPSRYPQTN